MKEVFIYLTLFVGVAFMFTPRGPMFDPFILVEHQVHAEDFAYYLWQHLIMIMVFYVILVESVSCRRFYMSVFSFFIVDMLDYWMTNNCLWITLDGQFLQQRSDTGALLSMNIAGGMACAYFLLLDKLQNK